MLNFRNLINRRFVQFACLLLGIFCLSLLAIQPFTLNQMPESADGLLHLFRVGATDYSLKVDNPLWIRYSTGIVYGYGAPLFNYFPPLSYYLGSWLHTLGLTFVQSWLMMMVIYTMTSALGMFFLGRIWTQSNVGGWVSAIAYIYAPYYLFDSVARGTSSELGALAVLPFALYGFTRLAFYGRRIDFLFAVGAFALFIPMHTLITLHGTVLMGLYCLFLWLTSDDKTRTFFRLLFAGGLAFMVTAFFWMPAIMETESVKINLIAEQLDQIDVTRHLRPIGDILALPHTADPTQQNQAIPITLSWVQLILAGFGLVIAWNDRSPVYRNLLLFLGVILGVLIFLNTPHSVWIWGNVPFMNYTQFPWRILGLASLVLALMAGISIWLAWAILASGWRKLAVFSVLALITVVYSIPWTYSLYFDEIQLDDIRDVHTFERETGQLTVSSYSEYLPVSTDESQLDPDRLTERFKQGDIIPRLVETDTFKIVEQAWTSTSGQLRIQSDNPQPLTFDWLWIEGWTATINDEIVTTSPSIPEGLVTVDVHEGEFDLDISLHPTPAQSASVGLSLIGIGLVIVVWYFWRYLSGFSNLHGMSLDPEVSIYFAVIIIGVGVFLFKALVLDHSDTSFKTERFGDLTQENAEIQPLANFGNQIDLVDTHIPEEAISRRILPIKLYWKLHDNPIETDYSAVIRMRNPDGIMIAEKNIFQLGGVDTSNWMRGAYIQDVIQFEVPQYTPPLSGSLTYSFEVSLFNADTLESINVLNAQGNPEDARFVFAELSLNERWMRFNFTNFELGDKASSMSRFVSIYEPIPPNFPDSASVGEEIIFDWTWQKDFYDGANSNHFARVQWLNHDLQLIGESGLIQLAQGYPTSRWARNHVVTAHNRLIVPPQLPADDYKIGIQIFDKNGAALGDTFVLQESITISEPERVLSPPDFAIEEIANWNNRIRLLGYDFDGDNSLNLIWKTNQIMDTNLGLFVHVLDDNDIIIAQSDGIPVNWTRPTTSWIPEEFITTTHTFDLPSGEYRVRVGWYDPVTGDRVGVGEDDSYILEQILQVD